MLQAAILGLKVRCVMLARLTRQRKLEKMAPSSNIPKGTESVSPSLGAGAACDSSSRTAAIVTRVNSSTLHCIFCFVLRFDRKMTEAVCLRLKWEDGVFIATHIEGHVIA